MTHPTDFIYQFNRASALGAAEAAPATPTGSMVWNLRPAKQDNQGEASAEVYDSLLLLSDVTFTYELAYWNTEGQATATWIVFSTGTLTANTPVTVPFPYEGAYVYVRRTSVTAANAKIYCQPKQASVTLAASSMVIVAALSHAEDAPHVSGDAGIEMLAVRADTAASSGANGDYVTLIEDSTGHLWTRDIASYAEDSVAVSGDYGIPALTVRRDVPVTSAGSDGDYATANTDADGFLYERSKSYDTATTSDKQFPIWSPTTNTPQTWLNATNTGAATVYYPASTGFDLTGLSMVSIEGAFSGGCTVTFEASNDSAFTTPKDISLSGYDEITGTYNANYVDSNFVVDFERPGCRYLRVKVIYSDASNASRLDVRTYDAAA